MNCLAEAVLEEAGDDEAFVLHSRLSFRLLPRLLKEGTRG